MATTGEGPRAVPISALSMQQLSELQQGVEKEVMFFQQSLSELREARQKYATSKSTVEFMPENNAESLLPLTESLYVPGRLTNTDKVMIEIGTGYFAEVPRAYALEHFQRKVDFITKQMDQVSTLLTDKQKTKAVLNEALKSRVQQMMAQQAQNLQNDQKK